MNTKSKPVMSVRWPLIAVALLVLTVIATFAVGLAAQSQAVFVPAQSVVGRHAPNIKIEYVQVQPGTWVEVMHVGPLALALIGESAVIGGALVPLSDLPVEPPQSQTCDGACAGATLCVRLVLPSGGWAPPMLVTVVGHSNGGPLHDDLAHAVHNYHEALQHLHDVGALVLPAAACGVAQ